MSTSTENVSTEEMNIEELMDFPSTDQEPKKGFFEGLNDQTEVSINEVEDAKAEKPKEEETEKKFEEPKADLEAFTEEDEEKPKVGSKLKNAIKSLIDEGKLLPFDDETSIDDYEEKDLKELLELNLQQAEANATQEVPKAFFDDLPPELQAAYSYYKSGGQDIKGMFRALSVSREITDLNIEDSDGQESVIRAYLTATRFGSPDEIEDEISMYRDHGDLERKAKQFKPKLEGMQNQIIQRKIQQQQQADNQRKQAMQAYADSVYDALDKDDLNGLHLTNSLKNQLYRGLVGADFQSASGKPTNQLYYLLEKYQWVEPNHGLLSEVLWHLSDPEGFKKALGSSVKKEVTEQTVRKLKNEQQGQYSGSQYEQKQDDRRTIRRPMRSLFK